MHDDATDSHTIDLLVADASAAEDARIMLELVVEVEQLRRQICPHGADEQAEIKRRDACEGSEGETPGPATKTPDH